MMVRDVSCLPSDSSPCGVSGWWMAFKQHFSSFRQPGALNGHKYWTHLTSFISAVALPKIGFRLDCCWDMCLLINSAAYEATIPLRANTWQCQMNGWMNTVFHTQLDGRHKIQWIFFSWKSLEAIETKKMQIQRYTVSDLWTGGENAVPLASS